MKLSLSLLLCSVLLYGTLFCLNVSADEEDNESGEGDTDDNTCITDYLKNKEKLADDVPSVKASSLCSDTMTELVRIVNELVKTKMETEVPDEANCVMEEFEKKEIVDLVLKMQLIRSTAELSEFQKMTKMQSTLNELQEELKAVGSSCGFEETNFPPMSFNGILNHEMINTSF